MAEIGQVRIRVPSPITKGEVVRIRALVTHPMEILDRDKAGKVIEKNYHFIHAVVVTYNGKEILRSETTQAVSQNPFFAFYLKASEAGVLKITFMDTFGKSYEGTAEIKF